MLQDVTRVDKCPQLPANRFSVSAFGLRINRAQVLSTLAFLLSTLRAGREQLRHRRRVEKSVISNAFRPEEGTPF